MADSTTKAIQERFGESFLGWSKSSSEENLIAVFRGAGPAMDYIKEFVNDPKSNCNKALFTTPQILNFGQQCKGLNGKIYKDPSCNYKCPSAGTKPQTDDPCDGYPESCTKTDGSTGAHYCKPGKILESGACGYSGDIANTTCSDCQ